MKDGEINQSGEEKDHVESDGLHLEHTHSRCSRRVEPKSEI